MQLGQVVDFVIAYNQRAAKAQGQAEKKTRKATQKDIDAFFG